MAAEEAEKYVIGPNGEKRLKGVQLAIPVVTGSIAFWLGKKATDTQSHKWTVYLRSPSGEDLTHVLKKVTFELHESFTNPVREIAHPPYELTEAGWGQFDIVITLYFHDDAQEPPLQLLHYLTLGLNEDGTAQKKPVLNEVYEEAVLWEPTEAFYERVRAHQPRAAPPSHLAQYFLKHNAALEYTKIQHARGRLAQATAHIKGQLAALEAEEARAAGRDTEMALA